MKRPLAFDPADYDYGPASASVRRVLSEYADVDWLAPPPGGTSLADGRQLFAEHQARASAFAPDLFAPKVEVRTQVGAWRDFGALGDRVQNLTTYDWRYGALKRLLHRHSEARGFRLDDQVRPDDRARHESGQLRPGELFVFIHRTVVWKMPFDRPDDASLPPEHVGDARWYLSYADDDALACIEWQIAEANDALDANPFYPLFRCYAGGFYPFVLGPTECVLFAFAGP